MAAIASPAVGAPASEPTEPKRAGFPTSVTFPAGQGETKEVGGFVQGTAYEFKISGGAVFDGGPSAGSHTVDAFYQHDCRDGVDKPPSQPDCHVGLPKELTSLKVNDDQPFEWLDDEQERPGFQGNHVYTLRTDKLGGGITFSDVGTNDSTTEVTGQWTIAISSSKGPITEDKVVGFSIDQSGLATNARPGTVSTTTLAGKVAFKKIKPSKLNRGTVKSASGSHADIEAAGELNPTETTTSGFNWAVAAEPKPAFYSVNGKGKKTLTMALGVNDSTLPLEDCPYDSPQATLRVVLKDDGAHDTLDFEPGFDCIHNEKFKSSKESKLRVNISGDH